MAEIPSNTRSKIYNPEDTVRILDSNQASLYWIHGVAPVDMFPTRDRETNRAKICFVFKKSETKEVFDLWCKHELL